METSDIMTMIRALEKGDKHSVNIYLQHKWGEGVNAFIETVQQLRSVNSELVDTYFNTSQSLNNLRR